MTTILNQSSARSKAHTVKIDMTPMVDLGFLLITFFIFTTAMTSPTVAKIIMLKDGPDVPVYEKTLLTILLDKNKVYVYEGAEKKALAAGKIVQTDYHVQTGLGHYIRLKQKQLDASMQKEDLMIAIKPFSSASYQEVINALDEMQINNVKRYAIIKLSEEEKAFVAAKN